MGRRVGIDLGTTNTVVAIADGSTARVLLNKEGEELTLSVVGVPRRGNPGDLLVGTPAYRNWRHMPRDTALSVKRLMGRGVEDEAVQTLKGRALYAIKAPREGTAQSLRVVLGETEYSPVEISAQILRKVKHDAEEQLDGDEITHAVITVPSYFSEVQRKATRQAAKEAGLEVIRILDEPTAAAIAFGLERGDEEPRIVLVYDFGGGTFDISILTWAGNNFAPMNLEGDMWLGGDDLDDVIVDRIASAVEESDDIDLRDHKPLLVEVKQEARKLKEQLSASESGDILITSAEVDIDFSITRTEFELAILDKVATFRACVCGQNNYADSTSCHACGANIENQPEQDGRAVALVRRALENAHLTLDDVDYVLLAGNSTLVPLVRRSMDKMFGKKIKAVSHPKLVVSQGAAIVAAQVGDRTVCSAWQPHSNRECGCVNDRGSTICVRCGAVLGDEDEDQGDVPVITVGSVAPFDYVLGLKGEDTFTFVRKGDPCPTLDDSRIRKTFYTQQANQSLVFLPIFGRKTDETESQGKAYVRIPDGQPAGFPVDVSLWMNLNGTFELEAHGSTSPLLITYEKGEILARAADELVAAEMVVEERRAHAKSADIGRIKELRTQVLEQMFNDEDPCDRAAETAGKMLALAQEWGKVQETLRQRVEYLANWAEGHIGYYGWAYDEEKLVQIRRRIEEARKALLPNADETLALQKQMLDSVTSSPPQIVQEFFALLDIITKRIEPKSPARAQFFRQELGAVRGRYVARDKGASEHMREVADTIHRAASELGVITAEEVRECKTCGDVLAFGARYCKAGHDSWLLQDHASKRDEGASL